MKQDRSFESGKSLLAEITKAEDALRECDQLLKEAEKNLTAKLEYWQTAVALGKDSKRPLEIDSLQLEVRDLTARASGLEKHLLELYRQAERAHLDLQPIIESKAAELTEQVKVEIASAQAALQTALRRGVALEVLANKKFLTEDERIAARCSAPEREIATATFGAIAELHRLSEHLKRRGKFGPEHISDHRAARERQAVRTVTVPVPIPTPQAQPPASASPEPVMPQPAAQFRPSQASTLFRHLADGDRERLGVYEDVEEEVRELRRIY
ncbi:MAG TPA: hypothetical protein VNN17_02415 [Terriglobia bacterium]|nr:hypothetical protein [Terriglobia bacterium]